MLDHRIGGVENISLRAIILFELDDVVAGTAEIVTLKVAHVAYFGAAEFVDTLVVITHRKHGRATTAQQPNPLVLKAIGILELIDQNELEALAIVLKQRRVLAQQFVTAQQ